MTRRWSLAFALSLAGGCNSGSTRGVTGDGGGGGKQDLSFVFPTQDDGGGSSDDGGTLPEECGEPGCMVRRFGPTNMKTFPLSSDQPPDPDQTDEGLGRDANGWLQLDQSKGSFEFLWLANTNDWNRGSVTKMNSKTLREVARYSSVTCFSNKAKGSTQPCDQQGAGCCARDSMPQWQNRKMGQPPGAWQQVNLMNNMPSRTAVDFNGDVWVANRAFSGQASATKIANDVASCVDRNGNGKIETSKDTNGDGIIQTDCNGDGAPDDIASVKAKPCMMPQEYFGLDDECVLSTTNYGAPQAMGRPLSLGPGPKDFGPSDVWAGTYQDGKFFRIDGTSGLIKDEVALPQGCQPYGAAVDSQGILWAPPLNSTGPLCYLNTKKSTEVGTVRNPAMGFSTLGYGISLDRDQNVWVAGCLSSNAYRYTPTRNGAFADLGKGFWTVYTCPGCNSGATGNRRGIAVDSRGPKLYFAWMITDSGFITRIDASSVPLPNGADVVIDAKAYPTVKIAGSYSIGVGIDRDQNLWGVSNAESTATRIFVDAMGTIKQPDLVSAPMGNNKCPAGDRCPYKDAQNSSPNPYTYSDFTGFGLRNFTRPKGTYTYVIKGCSDGNGPTDTEWQKVSWDADTPPNTGVSVAVRAGATPVPDQTWGNWTSDFASSPADLVTGMPLVPNGKDAHNLQVEFRLTTSDKNKTPRLKGFEVWFKCGNIPG